MVIFIVTACRKQQCLPTRTEALCSTTETLQGNASHDLGAASLTVKKGTIKKKSLNAKTLVICFVPPNTSACQPERRNFGAFAIGDFLLPTQQWYF